MLYAKTVLHMKKHRDRFEPLWDKLSPEGKEMCDFSAYLEELGGASARAGATELYTLSRVLNSSIVCVPEDATKPIWEWYKDSDTTLYVWFAEEHYQSLQGDITKLPRDYDVGPTTGMRGRASSAPSVCSSRLNGKAGASERSRKAGRSAPSVCSEVDSAGGVKKLSEIPPWGASSVCSRAADTALGAPSMCSSAGPGEQKTGEAMRNTKTRFGAPSVRSPQDQRHCAAASNVCGRRLVPGDLISFECPQCSYTTTILTNVENWTRSLKTLSQRRSRHWQAVHGTSAPRHSMAGALRLHDSSMPDEQIAWRCPVQGCRMALSRDEAEGVPAHVISRTSQDHWREQDSMKIPWSKWLYMRRCAAWSSRGQSRVQAMKRRQQNRIGQGTESIGEHRVQLIRVIRVWQQQRWGSLSMRYCTKCWRLRKLTNVDVWNRVPCDEPLSAQELGCKRRTWKRATMLLAQIEAGDKIFSHVAGETELRDLAMKLIEVSREHADTQ